MKKLLLILFLFTSVVVAGYFPSTTIIQGGNNLSELNPLPLRLSDGTNYYSPLTNAELRASAVPVSGTFYQAVQPVSQSGAWDVTILNTSLSTVVTSLPSITGTVTANLGTIAGVATESTLSSLNSKVSTTVNGIKVDGSSVTQPVSIATVPSHDVTQGGTWNINNIAGTVSLPTGAATASNQSTANSSLSSIDSKLPVLGQALTTSSIPVVLPASQIATLTPPTLITANLGTIAGVSTESTLSTLNNKIPSNLTVFSTRLLVDGSGVTQPISAASLPTHGVTQSGTWDISNISGLISLPTGASTSANQSTANSYLSSMDTKLPSLGQALAASSIPVVLPLSQITTLTPPTTITANLGTIAGVSTEATLSSLNNKVTTSVNGVIVDGSAVTQPISAAALPLPSGASTESTLSALNTKVTTTLNGVKVDGSGVTQPVSGPLTNTELRASDVPVSATSWPLPTGAATSANQSSEITAIQNPQGPVSPGTAATKSNLVGSVYNSTLPSPTNGQQVAAQSGLRGELVVAGRNTYSYITGNGTTTIKSGAGRLAGIIIGDNTTGGTLTIYDNTAGSGAIIAKINAGTTGGALGGGSNGSGFGGAMDIEFTTGLTVVSSGSTSNIWTLIYR